MNSILARLREPSTWAGIAVLITSASHFLPGAWGPVVMGVANTAGALAIALREKGGA